MLHIYTRLGWVHLSKHHTHLSRSLLKEPWLRANRLGVGVAPTLRFFTQSDSTAFLCVSLPSCFLSAWCGGLRHYFVSLMGNPIHSSAAGSSIVSEPRLGYGTLLHQMLW